MEATCEIFVKEGKEYLIYHDKIKNHIPTHQGSDTWMWFLYERKGAIKTYIGNYKRKKQLLESICTD